MNPTPIRPWGEPSDDRYPPGSVPPPVIPPPGTVPPGGARPGALPPPTRAGSGAPPGQLLSQTAHQALEHYYQTAYCALLWTIAGEMVWDASEVAGVALSPIERRALLGETVWLLIAVTGLPVDLSLTNSLLSVADDPPFTWAQVWEARECLWREFGGFIQAANRRRHRRQAHSRGNK